MPPPVGLAVESAVLRSLFSVGKVVRLSWDAMPAQVTGFHVYRSTVPHGGYERLTPSPIRGTTFVDRVTDLVAPCYYVVTSVDAAGQESNYSFEVIDNGAIIH